MKKEKRITIMDIAKKSGYSKTAVSFAFNAPERIGAEAREKILQVARELEFIPNPVARSLSLGRHQSVGFLLPQDISDTLLNPYIIDVIRGVGRICQDNGYMLTIIPPLHNSVYEAVRNATVDGIIAMGFFIQDEVADVLRQRKLPVVSIDGATNLDIPSVGIDDRQAGYLQMSAVVSRGHRSVAVISLPYDAYHDDGTMSMRTPVGKRREGYLAAVSEYGLDWDRDIMEFQCGVSYNEGLFIGERILGLSRRPSAVITMSDIVASGIASRFKEDGIVVGRDISIVGFDGLDGSYHQDPPLATISQPGEIKGQLAADLLFKILNGDEIGSDIIMPCRFVDNGSLGSCDEH